MQYPRNVLQSVFDYLKKLEGDLLKRKSSLAKEDPFADTSRLNDNASDDTEAAEQYGHAQAATLSEETSDSLKRVRQAMKRVDDGTYGKCIKCGEMIDTDRLGIDPTAELCMSCAKKAK
ncbi:TraR/DksA C4-type zinc finger protein [Candidatus Woesebacteria bacterium]|nr:TraR/DksA C4-type zinc finger protein [Candidatus Woesebacteria bacterium]